MNDNDSLPPAQPILDELCALGLPDRGWFEIRFTDLDGSVTAEKIRKWCETQSVTFLVGEENAKNHHFHLAIPYEKSPKCAEFTQSVYDFFQSQKIGNAFWKCSPVTDLEKYLPYCLKDNNFFSSPDLLSILPMIYDISFMKPQGYEVDSKLLFKEFQAGHTTPKELWVLLGELRAELDLRLNLFQLDELVFAQRCKKDKQLLKNAVHSRSCF